MNEYYLNVARDNIRHGRENTTLSQVRKYYNSFKKRQTIAHKRGMKIGSSAWSLFMFRRRK